jgi:hypothetical protein
MMDAYASVMTASAVLLLVQADNYSAWNDRKRCCTWLLQQQPPPHDQALSPFLSELSLCSLITSKHFKSAEAWSHRHWVLRSLSPLAARVDINELVAGEVKAVMAAVKMYALILLLVCKSVTLCVQVQEELLRLDPPAAPAQPLPLRPPLSRGAASHRAAHSLKRQRRVSLECKSKAIAISSSSSGGGSSIATPAHRLFLSRSRVCVGPRSRASPRPG